MLVRKDTAQGRSSMRRKRPRHEDWKEQERWTAKAHTAPTYYKTWRYSPSLPLCCCLSPCSTLFNTLISTPLVLTEFGDGWPMHSSSTSPTSNRHPCALVRDFFTLSDLVHSSSLPLIHIYALVVLASSARTPQSTHLQRALAALTPHSSA